MQVHFLEQPYRENYAWERLRFFDRSTGYLIHLSSGSVKSVKDAPNFFGRDLGPSLFFDSHHFMRTIRELQSAG